MQCILFRHCSGRLRAAVKGDDMPPLRSRPLSIAFACLLASPAAGHELAAPLASAPRLVAGNSVGSADFVGTRNNAALVFKSAGREAMRLLPTLAIGIGTTAPTSPSRRRPAPSRSYPSPKRARSGSDSISGVTYGAASVGVYAEGAGKNGYRVYAFTNGPGGTALLGYNHATGHAAIS